jgi:hypothetical protein
MFADGSSCFPIGKRGRRRTLLVTDYEQWMNNKENIRA